MAKSPPAPLEAAATGWTAARVKLVVGVLVVLLVGGLALAIILDAQTGETARRFDMLDRIRQELTPQEDPLFANPGGVYNPAREEYIATLENFLEREARPVGGVLEAQTRFYIARAAVDHVLANPEMFDREERARWYQKAREHLVAIRDNHPEFPLNWPSLATAGAPTLTRQFIDWVEKNLAWEQKHLPQARPPQGPHVLVLRTDAGDLRLRLYEEEAPERCAEILRLAVRGALDGRALVEKREAGPVSDAQEHSLRLGAAATRELKPYDRARISEIASLAQSGGHVPEESRNGILHERGVVSLWHDRATEYDEGEQLLFVVRRSPLLDYDFTPIGKLEGPESLATLDRIFARPTWRDDPETVSAAEWRGILDYLQVPVHVVKALVFDAQGVLVEPAEGEAVPGRAAPTAEEQKLAGLKADAYRKEPPPRHAPPPEDGAGGDEPAREPGKDEGAAEGTDGQG